MSAPAKARSERSTASSAPRETASLMASMTWGGPMESTVTLPPSFSRSLRPSSRAYMSKGLMMEGTPSRTRVLVAGSMRTSVVSGTCLMQTMMFMVVRLVPCILRGNVADNVRKSSIKADGRLLQPSIPRSGSPGAASEPGPPARSPAFFSTCRPGSEGRKRPPGRSRRPRQLSRKRRFPPS